MQQSVVSRADVESEPIVVKIQSPENVPRPLRMTRLEVDRQLRELPRGKMRRYRRVKIQ